MFQYGYFPGSPSWRHNKHFCSKLRVVWFYSNLEVLLLRTYISKRVFFQSIIPFQKYSWFTLIFNKGDTFSFGKRTFCFAIIQNLVWGLEGPNFEILLLQCVSTAWTWISLIQWKPFFISKKKIIRKKGILGKIMEEIVYFKKYI